MCGNFPSAGGNFRSAGLQACRHRGPEGPHYTPLGGPCVDRRSSGRFAERRFGGSGDDLAVRTKSRAVARAVPRALRLVPVDDASHVRADRRTNRRRPCFVAVHRDALSVQVENFSLASLDGTQRTTIAARKAIADDVVGVILVLADVVPQTSADLSPARVEELAPWIAPPEHAIRGH